MDEAKVDEAKVDEAKVAAAIQVLDRLRSILLEATAEPQLLRTMIRNGRAAGFGCGDL